MVDGTLSSVDSLVMAPAERLPFKNECFDIVICRQGIQFMDLPEALEEMFRVTKRRGRLVLVNLCAYGMSDCREYFEILRLRNPVRRHFFVPDDIRALLHGIGCHPVTTHFYVSLEDVDVWSANGAIDEARREAIREVYRTASATFRQLHGARQADGRWLDRMLFVVAVGQRP